MQRAPAWGRSSEAFSCRRKRYKIQCGTMHPHYLLYVTIGIIGLPAPCVCAHVHKHLLISWLQSPSAVILEPPKIKSDTVSTVSPSICHEVMGSDAMILVFWMLRFKPTFSLYTYTLIKRLFSSSSLSAVRVVSLAVGGNNSLARTLTVFTVSDYEWSAYPVQWF